MQEHIIKGIDPSFRGKTPWVPEKEYVDAFIDLQRQEIRDLEKKIDDIDRETNRWLEERSKKNIDRPREQPKQAPSPQKVEDHGRLGGDRPRPEKHGPYAGPDKPGPNITNTA